MILTIDATHKLTDIVQKYNWQPMIIIAFIVILIMLFFNHELNHRDENVDYFCKKDMGRFLIFIIVCMTICMVSYNITIGRTNFYKTHINPKYAVIRKETFDLSTNKKGDIKSYSNMNDKKGTLRLKIENQNKYVIVNKNNIKIYFNSDNEQTITLTTATDYNTNKKYYIGNNIKINNQSIEFK